MSCSVTDLEILTDGDPDGQESCELRDTLYKDFVLLSFLKRTFASLFITFVDLSLR